MIFRVAGVLLATTFVLSCGKSYTEDELADATARLRDLFVRYEYEHGTTEGRDWRDRAPEALELRAWYVRNLAATERADSAIAEAEAMVRLDPASPWSWFALAGALVRDYVRGHEAIEASDKALALAPGNLDFTSLRAETLIWWRSGNAAVAFIDSLPPRLREDPTMLVQRGKALWWQSMIATEPKLTQAALEFFEQAREKDPTNLEAYFHPGFRLHRERRADEALPLLERATSMTSAPEVHEELWTAMLGQPDLTADEKNTAVETRMDSLLALRGETSRTLRAIATLYRRMKQGERQKEFEDRLLELYPQGPDAERMLYVRFLRLGARVDESDSTSADSTREAFRSAVIGFIDRPYHHNAVYLGAAYAKSLDLVKNDSTVSDDDLYDVVRGIAENETYFPDIVEGALVLADRRIHLADAASMAQQGFEVAQAEEERDRAFYETEGEYQLVLDRNSSLLAGVLGWVHFNDGRLDDAEEQLLTARDVYPRNVRALYHLGRLYEHRATIAAEGGDPSSHAEYLERAEDQYIRGAMVPDTRTNPNDDALRALFEKRTGSLDGFEPYRRNIEEIDRERRRNRILAERIENPQPVQPFSLTTLTGQIVSFADVVGQIAVVNFWATWCAPCVEEMPEFQEFNDRYRSDDNVVVLTINMDYNPDDVPPWMEKNGYDFQVLLDDGYVEQVGFDRYPTTWFVDQAGRIVFVKKGWSESLAEEFGWRVEALRESGG